MAKKTSKKLRGLKVWIKRKLTPAAIPFGDGLHYWRHRVFHRFTMAFVAIGLVVYLYHTVSCLQNDKYMSALMSTFFFSSIVLVAILKRIPFQFKVISILLSVYILSCLFLILNITSALGLVLLLSFSMLSGMLLGRKGGVYSLVCNALMLMALGFLHHAQIISIELLQKLSLSNYMNLGIAFMLINIATLFPLISFINALRFTLEKELRYQSILGQEREKRMRAIVKAEESDLLKSSFLSNMSHEIRTPMNAILGFSNLLSHNEITTTEKDEFVKLINVNVKSLMTIVDGLIDISKIDTGQLQIRNSAVCLHDVMQEVHDLFARDLKSRGQFNIKLYLTENSDDKNTMVLTDGVRLKQVLIHLVGNGIKFTDTGYVEFGYGFSDDGVILFFVKDTGIGLPMGKEEQIFERFSKCSEGRQSLYGGTGIGLSLVKDLLNLMGGKIWLNAESAVGTSFLFSLPLHKVSSIIYKKKANISNETNKVNICNWKDKTFLIVEDEEDNFRYIEVVLSKTNATLIWARTGIEAIELFKRNSHIDLVLMDIKMPEMDGYVATQELKKINARVPIIAQTAYAMSEEREQSALAGCDDYISKPIGYDDLLSVIRKYMCENGDCV